MYEYADKVIRYLNKQYVRLFETLKRKTRSLATLDEITVLGYVADTYAELDRITTPLLGEIAKRAYKDANPDGMLAEMWVTG